MNMRKLKKNKFAIRKLLENARVISILMYEIIRKKDGNLVHIAESKEQAEAYIMKAKLAKKATLIIGGTYRQKYAVK